MSGGPAGAVPAKPSDEGSAAAEVCVLLACFAGAKRATKIRRQLDKVLVGGGDTVLDQVVLKVDAKHKAQVYDPRRTLAGCLTSALTWGIFGLLAGGLEGLGVWAVLGAVCGGLYAYYTEHLLAKDELTRIGGRLPGDSSAVLAFVRGTDPRRVLSATASFEPSTASAAVIGADLSARAYGGAPNPVETSAAPASSAPTVAAEQAAELSMLLVRFAGERGARRVLGKSGSASHQDQKVPQVELVIEANEHGRRRVIDPTTGTAAFAKSDTISWGLFGLVWGIIVGFIGDGGVLGAIDSGLVTGILWALFGVVAGALYGLWAGRGLSARRLKGLGAFVPPGTSLLLAWAEGRPSQETIQRWAAPGSQRLILRFNPLGHGAVMEV
ncbi:hypothetical protein AB0I34_20495 [Kribbella sp. NPDC050281]|uniref:hypothetical protein n=1 Tax=Kribbella sp. NPDC050281 TaxID=3155515 RepID=UPI0033C5DD6B